MISRWEIIRDQSKISQVSRRAGMKFNIARWERKMKGDCLGVSRT